MKKKLQTNQAIKDSLAKQHLCYVLLTCDTANGSGHMHVDMSYEGDPVLASYLLHGAQTVIDEAVCESGCQAPYPLLKEVTKE